MTSPPYHHIDSLIENKVVDELSYILSLVIVFVQVWWR